VTDRLTAALADRYRIERELGAGGMGSRSELVLKARQQQSTENRRGHKLRVSSIRQVLDGHGESSAAHVGDRDARLEIRDGERVDVAIPDTVDHSKTVDVATAKLHG